MYTIQRLAMAAVNKEFSFLHLKQKTAKNMTIVEIIIPILKPQPVPVNQMKLVIIKATEAENRRIVYVSKTPFLQVSSVVSDLTM